MNCYSAPPGPQPDPQQSYQQQPYQQQQPYLLPYVPPEVAAHTESLVRENEQLHHQLIQKSKTELAYTKFYEGFNKNLLVMGRAGPIAFLDHAVEAAYHIIPSPPFKSGELYLVYLTDIDRPLNLSAKEYESDRKFLAALQELPGVTVTFVNRSRKITVDLLKSAFASRMKTIHPSFYGGWMKDREYRIYFQTFSGGQTHQCQGQFEDGGEFPQISQTVAATAAKQFWQVFRVIRPRSVQLPVVLWFHTAAIHTLLRLLGVEVPLAFSVFATNTVVQAFLRWLFSWYGDAPISLELSPADFALELLSRKDQPLLVEDRGRLRNSQMNAQVLEEALVHRQAPWKFDREGIMLPLQAPITLLSSRASALSCAPEVIATDLASDDFDRDKWLELMEAEIDHQDYLAAFVSYTESHVHELNQALLDGKKATARMSDGTLNTDCIKMMEIFTGIMIFMKKFSRYCGFDTPPVDCSKEQVSDLYRLLRQTTEQGSILSVAETFAAIVRRWIRSGTLIAVPRTKCCSIDSKTVIYDEHMLYFTVLAFSGLCKALRQSQPAILRELSGAGILCGTPTNSTTFQTRIRVRFESGTHETIPVYAVNRSAIEDFCDPLPLKEENYES